MISWNHGYHSSLQRFNPEQRASVRELLAQFKGEVSQCSLHPQAAQVVLNKNDISSQRGQLFLDGLVRILMPERWGTDLPIRFPERNQPPDEYALRYRFSIPYDPKVS